MRRLHLALFAMLIGLGSAPLYGASPASVSGVVRDSAGVPQIGALVQLLRSDMSVVATAYTSPKGQFTFGELIPGKYAVKAMGTSFLPSLRENVRVRASTVVNLTLNTLYEVMQWLPAEPRSGAAQKDDWAWTLRSAANRPLLRWLEDGPLVVVSEKAGAAPKLKARLMATGHEGTFGENGERISAVVEDTPSESREFLARVDFEPGTDAGMESMLGFRQELGVAGSVQSVAAVTIHPEIEGAGSEGVAEAAVRSSQNLRLGDEFEVEAGAEQVLARFAQGQADTSFSALPFFSAGWRDGDATVRYRLATMVPGFAHHGDSEPAAWLPALAVRNGKLAMERGLHQELGWERKTDRSGVSVVVFGDRLLNPVVEAMTRINGNSNAVAGDALIDRSNGMMRASAAGYSTVGMTASAEHRLLGGNTVRFSYANGSALALPPMRKTIPLSQILAAARPKRAQTYSISLSGILDGSGTRWHASYRWQPEDTVNQVAAFATDADEPFLNLHLRQPVTPRHEGTKRVDVLVDVHNLLAQGFRPYLMPDGSLLMFAQDQRGVSGGLAFTF